MLEFCYYLIRISHTASISFKFNDLVASLSTFKENGSKKLSPPLPLLVNGGPSKGSIKLEVLLVLLLVFFLVVLVVEMEVMVVEVDLSVIVRVPIDEKII